MQEKQNEKQGVQCDTEARQENSHHVWSVWRTKDNGLRSARLEKVDNHLGIDLAFGLVASVLRSVRLENKGKHTDPQKEPKLGSEFR